MATNWFTSMSVRERQTFWACLTAWALDAMDVQVYALVMPTLIASWGLSKSQAGLLATSALLVSSLGGWIAGILADRFGRAKILRLTIVWFATFTFLSGLTHSYTQLMVTRSLQGLGFGGEWAAGAVLIAEVIDKRKRGRAVGTVQSGWSVGYGAAVLLYGLVFSLLPPAQAWRVLFFVGLVPALLVLWICRNVDEPDAFRELQGTPQTSRTRTNFLAIFQPPLLGTTVVASVLSSGALGGNYTILTWLPAYLKTVRHLSVLNTSGYLAVNICGSFCGYIFSAHLSDWLGRRRTFAITSLSAALSIAIYTFLPLTPSAVLWLGLPLGFFQSGIIAGMGATFAELYPTRVRATGQGFSYNTGRGAGSTAPTIVGFLTLTLPLGHAIGVCAICSYVLVLLSTALLPETRGKDLEANE
jgi:MFS family permease